MILYPEGLDRDHLERLKRRRTRRQLIIWRWIALAAICLLIGLVLGLCRISKEAPAYAEPYDPVWEGKVANAADYIVRVNPDVDADMIARMIVRASGEAGLEPPGDYRLLLALARYETTFRMDCHGRAGERGLLQVHPVHFNAMRYAGLDPDSEYDQLLYGALMISWSLQKGQSLHTALQPWTVRSRALAELRRIPRHKPVEHMEML